MMNNIMQVVDFDQTTAESSLKKKI